MNPVKVGVRPAGQHKPQAAIEASAAPTQAAQEAERQRAQLSTASDSPRHLQVQGGASLGIGNGARLPRALLTSVTPYQLWDIADYLTFTDAVRFMPVSRRIRLAVSSNPRLRLDELSSNLDGLGCNRLVQNMQTVERDLEALRSAQDTRAAASAATARAITLAGHQFTLPRLPTLQALQVAARVRQTPAHAREQQREAERAQLATQLQQLEPGIVNVVFHFASLRQQEPRPAGAEQPADVPVSANGKLHKAIEDGDVATIRTLSRELLSLGPLLMPQDRKLAWLRGPNGLCTLEEYAQRYCGTLGPAERAQYDAIRAYVDEIASSEHLSARDKQELCVTPRVLPPTLPGGSGSPEANLFRQALRCNNPAVAAVILLGIYESSAEPATKRALLAAATASWEGGVAACVGYVAECLNKYARRAPVWVKGVVDGLERLHSEGIGNSGSHH